MIRRSTGTSLLLAEAGAGVVGAEGIDHAAGRGVVDDAAFDAFDVVIIGIHEVHAGDEQRLIGKRAVALTAAVAVVGHALEGLQEAFEGQAGRRKFRLEALVELLPGVDLGEKLDLGARRLARGTAGRRVEVLVFVRSGWAIQAYQVFPRKAVYVCRRPLSSGCT